MANEYDYILMPENIEDGNKIIVKLYNHFCLLSILKGKHELIPPIMFKKLRLREITDKSFLPLELTEEEIILLEMYSNDEIDSDIFAKEMGFPLPFLKEEKIIRYRDIAVELSKDNKWLFQLIEFFSFLTEVGIKILDNIDTDGFLYNQDGSIQYFIGFSNLILTNGDKRSLYKYNLYTLASLLNKYYLKDTERYQAHLYHQKWFEKIEKRLIGPFLYNKYSAVNYSTFIDVIDDLQEKKMKVYPKQNIGIFLDVANIMTPLFNKYSRIEIDFDKLVDSIYSERKGNKICKREAVIFLPNYQGQAFREDKYKIIFEIKDYLESYGFQIFTVENEQAAAKEIVEGKSVDIDDMKLIGLMENSINHIDAALLLTGDRHFYDIASKYKLSGKDIKLISVSEENTSNMFIEGFDHSFIYEYWDCIYFS